MISYAYLAGLIDGDGSIGLHRRKKTQANGAKYFTYTIAVQLTCRRPNQNVIKFLWELKGRFGGSVGCYKYDTWRFYIGSRKAKRLLKLVKRYLINKRRQCELVLNMPVKWGGKPRTEEFKRYQEDLFNYLMQLNRGLIKY